MMEEMLLQELHQTFARALGAFSQGELSITDKEIQHANVIMRYAWSLQQIASPRNAMDERMARKAEAEKAEEPRQ